MKQKIITFFSVACIAFGLLGCTQSSWLYRINVQQGNIVTPDLVKQLRQGMCKEAVCDLLGPPVLTDTFNDNRWTYIYTFKPGKGPFIERNLVIYFRNDRVYSIHTQNLN